jgi:hypothetical protein
MAATPPSVEEALRLTRQAFNQFLRVYSITQMGREINTVDMDIVYAAAERAVRAANVADLVRFEHNPTISGADYREFLEVCRAAVRHAAESLANKADADNANKRQILAGFIAGSVGELFFQMVRGKPVYPSQLIESYRLAMIDSRLTITPKPLTSEDVDRALKKSTRRILEVLNTVRPAAPNANNAVIERIRAICHRYYPTGILPFLDEFRSKGSFREQMDIAHSIQHTLFSEEGEDLGPDDDSAEARIRCFTLLLLLRALAGYADGKEMDPTVITFLESAREAGTSDAFFAVRDPPPCTVCGKPAPFLCEGCVKLYRPNTPYCSVECQTRDWPTHRAKHIVPPIEHVERKQRKSRRRTYRNLT